MSTRVGHAVTRKVLVSIVFLALVLPPMALASPAEVLTNESILALLGWQAKPQEVVTLIERNATRFDLSAESLSDLRAAGVPAEVLDAMWKATLKASDSSGLASGREQFSSARRDSITARRATRDPKARKRRVDDAAELPADLPSSDDSREEKPAPRPHSPADLERAKRLVADTVGPDLTGGNLKPLAYDESCPLTEADSGSGKKKVPRYNVDLDWKTGSISPSCVDHSTRYCFALHNVNNILYTYSFTVNRIEPQGSDVDLLKDAIAKVKGLFAGEAPATTGTKNLLLPPPLPPPICSLNLEPVKTAAKALEDALSQLEAPKDASGKTTSVSLDTTLSKWQAVPARFKAFEEAIRELFKQIAALDANAQILCEPELGAAEALVLEVFVPARELFLKLASRANSQHVARYTTDLDATNAYDVVVKEFSGGQQTTADAKTFHLNACRKILVSSAGFLLTQLQARTYSSRTVPDENDPTKTQNVLGVDGGGRPRTALMALLNYNLPWQPWRNGGFAISAGPVFDIANGKADTSRFGFFGGVSLHLWNRLFLTPGVHVGEFADFPLGFNKPGQLIPADTGTPTPVKRYTARFAIGITFKVSELGFGGGGSTDTTAKKPASSQPKADTP